MGSNQIRKTGFFWTLSERARPPRPPLSIWTPKNFLLRKILDWARPPPSFTKNIQKKPSFRQNIQKKCDILPNFQLKPFWIGWDPPPFRQKSPKKSEFFLLRKFWIRRDPPAPLSENVQKKPVFLIGWLPLHLYFFLLWDWLLNCWLFLCVGPCLRCCCLSAEPRPSIRYIIGPTQWPTLLPACSKVTLDDRSDPRKYSVCGQSMLREQQYGCMSGKSGSGQLMPNTACCLCAEKWHRLPPVTDVHNLLLRSNPIDA